MSSSSSCRHSFTLTVTHADQLSITCSQQEFEAGTADNFASFPQQNGMQTCYNLLFVSPLNTLTTSTQLLCTICYD